MNTTIASPLLSPRLLLLLTAALCMLWLEPALANKFETIGGGVTGSSGVKRAWLEKFFFVGAALCLVGAILAVVIPHRNPLYLNYNNWKSSAIIMGLLSLGLLFAGLLI